MSELDTLLTRIDALKIRLDAARPLTSAQLQQALDIEYTFESNRIEGNTLTLRETDLVVNKGLTIGGKPLREHLEAINHYEAILHIRELADQGAALDEREVRNLHALVLRGIDRDNAGRYRNLPVMIAGSRHLPPQPWAVPKLMEDYGLWLTDQSLRLHPVVRAAEAHQRLVTIHPFIDGNGRTARLVMNLILLANGYAIANIPGDTDSRRAYYDALERANLEGDKTDFITLIAGHVHHAIQTLLERLGAA
ncbi:Fic family protein [Thiococcus pfennigii]|uniref:Fic family protein n=1 Tax=Thiococcus pfennigii TaxID=1057 RepID=UPI001902EBBE|nr:Fic family protein [Thiococcus pfennigii]MBK1731453.1 cell filamentation protein Fic [Thiococcus pfennigii]